LVSNPWREAIEVDYCNGNRHGGRVSNPWREAIEEGHKVLGQVAPLWFPILGGRLLKHSKETV